MVSEWRRQWWKEVQERHSSSGRLHLFASLFHHSECFDCCAAAFEAFVGLNCPSNGLHSTTTIIGMMIVTLGPSAVQSRWSWRQQWKQWTQQTINHLLSRNLMLSGLKMTGWNLKCAVAVSLAFFFIHRHLVVVDLPFLSSPLYSSHPFHCLSYPVCHYTVLPLSWLIVCSSCQYHLAVSSPCARLSHHGSLRLALRFVFGSNGCTPQCTNTIIYTSLARK